MRHLDRACDRQGCGHDATWHDETNPDPKGVEACNLCLCKDFILVLPRTDQPQDTQALSNLIARFREREVFGREKYGTTMDRTDLSTREWKQHLREELMDALLYLERL